MARKNELQARVYGLFSAIFFAGPAALLAQSASQPPVQSSPADLLLKGEFKSMMWEDTYTYQDGAFWFVGHGAWPFWVCEEHPDEKLAAGPNVPTPLDYCAETVDEVIPFAMDEVVPALKSAVETESCKVMQEAEGRIECKRPRVTANSHYGGFGGESVTSVLEARGDRTHVRTSTGKGF